MTLDPKSAPAGLALPEGNRTGPNCGVTAVAMVTGRPFDEVWQMMAPRHPPRWRGITNFYDWSYVLKAWGFDHTFVAMRKRRSLRTWVRTTAVPGTTYLVRTGGHIQVVKDGWVADQHGPKPIAEFWGRNKRVTCYVIMHL